MNDKVHALPGVTVMGSMDDALARMKRDMPQLLEYNELSSHIWRKKYLALVKEGFTPEQALTLCSKTI